MRAPVPVLHLPPNENVPVLIVESSCKLTRIISGKSFLHRIRPYLMRIRTVSIYLNEVPVPIHPLKVFRLLADFLL
jgi:hypothetical protein